MKKLLIPITTLCFLLLLYAGCIGFTPIRIQKEDIDTILIYYRTERAELSRDTEDYNAVVGLINQMEYKFSSIRLFGSKGADYRIECYKNGDKVREYFIIGDRFRIDGRIYETDLPVSQLADFFPQ